MPGWWKVGVTMPSILALPTLLSCCPELQPRTPAPAPRLSADPILAPLARGVPLPAPPVLTPPALSPTFRSLLASLL